MRHTKLHERLPETLGCRGDSAALVHKHQRFVTIAAGTELFVQSSLPHALYLLLTGTLHIIAVHGQREAYMGEIAEGKLCDIAACVLGKPHHFTTRSATQCDLVALPIEIWQQLLRDFPFISINLANQLAADLQEIFRNIALY